METYKTSVMQVLDEHMYAHFRIVDNALHLCVSLYYYQGETDDLLNATLGLFDAVRNMMHCYLGGITDKQVVLIAKDMLCREMRDYECLSYDEVSDDVLWETYERVVEKSMDYELERSLFAVRKFQENARKFCGLFGSKYMESES